MKRCTLAMVLVSLMIAVIAFSAIWIPEHRIEAASYKYGMQGPTIKDIQTRLKRWGYYNGSVDGIYGSATVRAVKYFQSANGLRVDGIVGPATANAIGIRVPNDAPNNADLYLLARIIHAEARGEPYLGQVAVGAVILNRVKSPLFPNTIAGVIYQPGAFTAVSDGQINIAPDTTSVKAAQAALNGYDPTYGCIYYYNPAKTTNAWIYSRKVVTVIGEHRFAL